MIESIPIEEYGINIRNPNSLTVKEQWKILTFCSLENIVGKPYNHQVIIYLQIYLRIRCYFFIIYLKGPFDVIIKFQIEDDLKEDNQLL